MKKKILFIISNMESGGVSKSMSSLLNVINTDKYEVDCFITSPTGIFMDTIPSSVNVITDKKAALAFSSFPNNILQLVRHGFWKTACLRIIAACLMLINKGYGGWVLSKILPKIPTNYDLAVDYNGQHQLYYLIDRIKSIKKITFFHNDYSKWDYYYQVDKRYYPKANQIYTVSQTCVSSLCDYFQSEKSKIGLFENISAVNLIERLSLSKIADLGENAIVTIGHLTERKGTSLAIEAAALLKRYGKTFKWYFVGQDLQDMNYKALVSKYSLDKYIEFVGVISNPYPYMRQATLLVHPSQFEGKSIALDEAKILCKPIVVTNFSTVYDQFTDRVNASICEMNAEDLAKNILELLENKDLRDKYIESLQQSQKDNTAEIEKLYKIIDIIK